MLLDTNLLRQKVLDLAIKGQLVPQYTNEESATELLKEIKDNIESLICSGDISLKKRNKTSASLCNTDTPYDLPRGWVWCTLDDLAFYKKGPFGSSLTKSMFVPDGSNSYKVYEQKNAIQKSAELGTYFISKAKFESMKGFEVKPCDIIVSCAGTIGEAYMLPNNIRPGIINQALMIIRLYNKEIANFFLLYFDFALKSLAKANSKGSAIKNIPPFKVLKQFYFPLPPLEEQKRIVAKVEEIFAELDAIDKAYSDLEQLGTLSKSKILDLAIKGQLVPQLDSEPAVEQISKAPKEVPFDIPEKWKWVSLRDVGTIISGGTPKTSETSYWGNDVSWITPADLGKLKEPTIYSGARSISFAGLKNSSARLIPEGSVVYSSRAPIGHIAIAGKELTTNQGCKSLYPNTTVLSSKWTYFTLIARTKDIQQRATGTTFKEISAKGFAATLIPLPPLEEQKRIVAKVEELFALIDAMKK